MGVLVNKINSFNEFLLTFQIIIPQFSNNYGPDLKRVLYVFNSKTSLYNEFNIHWSTVDKYLDKLDNKLYEYFSFSTLNLEGSDLDNLLSLNELLDIKSKVDPNIPRRGQRVRLKDLTNSLEYEFYSLSKAAKFIEGGDLWRSYSKKQYEK